MKGSDQVGFRRTPPEGRRKSGISSVVFGMICGIVFFGGMLVVINEMVPPGRQGADETAKPAATEKPAVDAPKVAIEDNENDGAPDGAGVAASEDDAETAKATDPPKGNETAADAPSSVKTSDNDPSANDPSLVGSEPENAPAGIEIAPEIRLTGPANRVNARAFNGPANAGLLSVVLYGGSETLTAEALATLAMPLTLAIRADRPEGIALAESAVGLGYEILAVLPLAVADQNTAGQLTDRDTPARLESGAVTTLASMGMAVGAVAPVGAEMLDRPEAMTPLLKPVASHSFLWVEPQPSSRSAAARMAAESDLIFLQASVFAGPGTPESVLAETITTAANQARARGTAVLFLEASQESMRALWKWSLERREPGVVLAPISAVAKKRGKG